MAVCPRFSAHPVLIVAVTRCCFCVHMLCTLSTALWRLFCSLHCHAGCSHAVHHTATTTRAAEGNPLKGFAANPNWSAPPYLQTVPSSIEFYYFTLRQIMTGMNDFPGFASVLEPAFNVISDRRGAPVQHLHRAWRWREPKLQRHQPHASARIIHCSTGAKIRRRSTAWIHSGGSAGFLGRMAHPPPLQLDPRESQECRGGRL